MVVLKSRATGDEVVLKRLGSEHRNVSEALTTRQTHGRFADSTQDAEFVEGTQEGINVSGASSLWRTSGLSASGRLRVSPLLRVAQRRSRASRRLGVSRYAWVVVCAGILWLGAPTVASAATGWGPPANINSSNPINSVSCPTSSFCVAVTGSQNPGDVLIDQNGTWGSPSSIDGTATLSSVSCSSASYCVAVDESGNEVTYDNGTWSTPAAIDSGGMGLISVSCPASTTVPAPFCVTVDLSGNALTDNNGTWGTPSAIDTVGLPDSVSCPSSSFCMAIDLEGNYLTYNGTSWTAPAPIISGTIFMVSVSCPTSTFCAAIGNTFGSGAINANGLTWNGTSWSAATQLSPAVGSFDEGAISCPSATFCQAVYSSADAAEFNGVGWVVASGIDQTRSLSSVSCPSQEFCEAVDASGFALTFTGPPPIPVNGTPPSISGTPIVGRTLSVVHGTWSNPPIKSYTYQWEDCDPAGNACVPIANNATNRAYTVQTTDVGHAIEVQESATNAGGTSLPATSAPTSVAVPPVPKNTSVPTISGNTTVGQTLTESHAKWTNGPVAYSYQWEDCNASGGSCAQIMDAMDQTYKLTPSDVGHTIRVQEFATNAGGPSASPAISAHTAAVEPIPIPPSKPANFSLPVISGSAVVGQMVSTSPGGWSGTAPISYAYQWERCSASCSDIGGATGSSYTLTSADQSAIVEVIVTAHNTAGTVAATSLPIGPVTVPGPTASQIRAALLAILGAHGKNASIRSLLKHGGYTVSFNAPGAGQLVISWYATPRAATSAKAKKPVLIASARASFQNAGPANVKIKLTRKGRSLLKHSKRLKLNDKASFTPTGQPSTNASKGFSIKR